MSDGLYKNSIFISYKFVITYNFKYYINKKKLF